MGWWGRGRGTRKNRKLLYSFYITINLIHRPSRISSSFGFSPSFVPTSSILCASGSFLASFLLFPLPTPFSLPSLPLPAEKESFSTKFRSFDRRIENNSTRRIRFHAGGIGQWPFVGATFTWTPICWNVLLLRAAPGYRYDTLRQWGVNKIMACVLAYVEREGGF